MIKDFLQGKPLGHPLHPALVHLPIGLFILSFLFDIPTIFGEAGNTLVRAAFYTMLAAVIMALVAAIPGLVDWYDIRADHPAKQTATYHMWLNVTAVVLYAINLGSRYFWSLNADTTPAIPFLLSAAGVAILSMSSYWGGSIVYKDGIGVGRHYRHTRTPEKTIRVSSELPEGWALVAQAEQLSDGETLRAEVDGYVMTIVNLNNKVYAFQEFCTHRFGPLSEGHFEDHHVICPWHRSCFDVRTGKVTEGPAKIDLKTFEVRIIEGNIQVQAPQVEREER